MRKVIVSALLFLMIFITCISCARSITPFQAANGGAKCGRTVR